MVCQCQKARICPSYRADTAGSVGIFAGYFWKGVDPLPPVPRRVVILDS